MFAKQLGYFTSSTTYPLRQLLEFYIGTWLGLLAFKNQVVLKNNDHMETHHLAAHQKGPQVSSP